MIRCHNTEVSDNVWMTCCALHNLLLDVDGLSHKWNEDAVASAYVNNDGLSKTRKFLRPFVVLWIRLGMKVTDCERLIVRDLD